MTKYQIFTLVLLFLFVSCIENQKKEKEQNTNKSNIKYAQTFAIQDFNGYKKLIVFSRFKGDTIGESFYLLSKNKAVPFSLKNEKIIRTPIEKIIVTSTTHIPMLELINAENSIVGFPHLQHISSPKTRKLIDNGQIKELGSAEQINIETIISLDPDLVVSFNIDALSNTLNPIKRIGIPVITNSDWLENEPLGRAEWVKFFGVLYEKDSLANAQFDKIETNYISLKQKIKQQTTTEYKVLSGALFQDVWYVPAGDSYMAHFLKDGGTKYSWADTKGSGSLPLSIESVLSKAGNVDFWIAPGVFTTKKALLHDSPHYQQIKAFQENNIYAFSKSQHNNKAILFYELAAARPDLVLEDFYHIFHNVDSLQENLHFFQKLIK